MSEVDLSKASRDELAGIIVRQQALINQLERRMGELEGRLRPGGPRRIPGNKPGARPGPREKKAARKPCPHGFTRERVVADRPPAVSIPQTYSSPVAIRLPVQGSGPATL